MLAACQGNPEKQTPQYLLGKKTLVPAPWLLPQPTSPQELVPEEGRGLGCLEPKQPSPPPAPQLVSAPDNTPGVWYPVKLPWGGQT